VVLGWHIQVVAVVLELANQVDAKRAERA